MTVSSEVKRSDYAGNGSTTAFATGFRFLQNGDLKVILTVDATGVETIQTEITNYTVTGAGLDAGGTVTMLVAPASGETLTIKRDIALTQTTDYVENDAFPAESHEQALDKLTMLVQQLQEELDRSIKLSEAQTSSGLTLPVPVTDRFLQWDSDGNLKNVDISLQGALAVSAFAQTYLDELTAAATRAVLETKESFTDLDETPSSFTGQAFKGVATNSGENALEFVSILSTDNYAYFREEQTSGTEGGASVAGTQVRVLNTEVTNNIPGCSLASNQITLAAGTYYFRASTPSYRGGRHKALLYNATDTANLNIGSTEISGNGDTTQTSSYVSGTFTLAASKDIELRHYIQVAVATNGLGTAASASLTEVYSELELWRVA